jgi:phage FluMu gp28-like protein
MKRLSGKSDRKLRYTSADESAAYEFAEYCRFYHERVQAAVDFFTEELDDAHDSKGPIKAFCIRFPNGSRINCLSSSPRRLRSKGGDVVISEYAFHDNPGALYAAAQPVMMWGDTMTIGSTHNGEGSSFNQMCIDAKAYRDGQAERGGRPLTPWSFHRIPITVAVDEGLVELINAERGTDFTREGFLAQLRAGCRDEDHWLQEYMCQPSTESSAWLTYDLIRTCEDLRCPQPGEVLDLTEASGERYAGIDVGRKKDLTVLWIVHKVGDVLWTRRIEILEKTPIPDQVDFLAEILRQLKVRRTCVDATGLGIGLSDGLQKIFGTYEVEAVTFTNAVKERLAVPMRSRFEDRTVRIPDNGRLREGLHKIRKTVTATGAVRFEAERDDAGHADEFWALALAMEAATNYAEVGVSVIH